MRRRSGRYSGTDSTEVSLQEQNREIAHMEWRAICAPINNQFRKSAYLKLLWLDAEREKLFGVMAPARCSFQSR